MTTSKAVVARPTGLTGAAGEYYVAAELSLRGWLATDQERPAYRRVGAEDGNRTTARNPDEDGIAWLQLSTRDQGREADEANNEWYVLVSLRPVGERPMFHVIPRNVVAAVIFAQKRHWLAIPSRTGAPHKDEPRRALRPKFIEDYRERWDLLDLPTTKVPLLLDKDVLSVCRAYGPSDGHPGWPRRLTSTGARRR